MTQYSEAIPDPFSMLGVTHEADDAEIRSAYLARLKQYPPERAPEQFERVRDAYELLRDRRRRAEYTLFSAPLEAPLSTLLEADSQSNRYVGPTPWLAVFKEQ